MTVRLAHSEHCVRAAEVVKQEVMMGGWRGFYGRVQVVRGLDGRGGPGGRGLDGGGGGRGS